MVFLSFDYNSTWLSCRACRCPPPPELVWPNAPVNQLVSSEMGCRPSGVPQLNTHLLLYVLKYAIPVVEVRYDCQVSTIEYVYKRVCQPTCLSLFQHMLPACASGSSAGVDRHPLHFPALGAPSVGQAGTCAHRRLLVPSLSSDTHPPKSVTLQLPPLCAAWGTAWDLTRLRVGLWAAQRAMALRWWWGGSQSFTSRDIG
jgi:hypothetical protein